MNIRGLFNVIGPASVGFLFSMSSCRETSRNTATNQSVDTMNNITKAGLVRESFGQAEGQDISRYTLTNEADMVVTLINYGATITGILVPDSSGAMGDVVLGFPDLSGYLSDQNPFFGCLTGRYANRIAKGRFKLDGKTYQLPVNNGVNTLHGGIRGFNRKIFTAVESGDSSVKMTYLSKDGEEGFPGNCNVEVVYTLSAANELRIDYMATTDKATPVNLTNHSYFNLSSGKDSTVLAHDIMIAADRFVEVNNDLIPTGTLEPVKGTAMDLTIPVAIGTDIAKVSGGFDHTYVLRKQGMSPELAAKVYHAESGRIMEVYTTEPGIQFYSGNFLDGSVRGKKDMKYVKHGGLCLEAQHFPDSPNQPEFPETIVRPGEVYRQTTIYKFSVK